MLRWRSIRSHSLCRAAPRRRDANLTFCWQRCDQSIPVCSLRLFQLNLMPIRAIHAKDAYDTKDFYLVGTVASSAWLHGIVFERVIHYAHSYTSLADEHPPSGLALHPHKWTQATLIERRELTHDTRHFRFSLPAGSKLLGLPTGQHVLVGAEVKARFIVRPYTPTRPASANV